MLSLHRNLFVFILVLCTLTAGCAQFPPPENPGNGTAGTLYPGSVSLYQRTIAQPGESSGMIRMDTDVYNIGEVVEFTITNNRKEDLPCSGNPPSFTVRYQKGTGQWVIRMGEEKQGAGTAMKLNPGASTTPYRFRTDGWDAGRYRIVTDCGISREFLLRSIPSMTTAAPYSCSLSANATPFIHISPISNQGAGVPFRISGTTNLPANDVLRYSLFAIVSGTTNITSSRLTSSTITIYEGECGTNTWSVEGVIKVPGDYFIGVSDSRNTVSAVRRFTVLEKTSTAETATLPEETRVPGITTG